MSNGRFRNCLSVAWYIFLIWSNTWSTFQKSHVSKVVSDGADLVVICCGREPKYAITARIASPEQKARDLARTDESGY